MGWRSWQMFQNLEFRIQNSNERYAMVRPPSTTIVCPVM